MVRSAAEIGNTKFIEIGELLDKNFQRVDELGLEQARLLCYVCPLWHGNVCLGLLSDGFTNRHIGLHLRGTDQEKDEQLGQILDECLQFAA